MIQSSGHSIHYHKIPYQVHHVGCVASKWQMTWSVSIVTDDKRMQTQKRLDFSCNPIKLLLCHSKLGPGGFEKSATMCKREGVQKNFFLGDFSQMWLGGVADSQTRPKPLDP